jgi:hypothetical protein
LVTAYPSGEMKNPDLVTLDRALGRSVESIFVKELLERSALQEGRQILFVPTRARRRRGIVHLDAHGNDRRLHLGDEIGEARRLRLTFCSLRRRSPRRRLNAAVSRWAQCDDRADGGDRSQQHQPPPRETF